MAGVHLELLSCEEKRSEAAGVGLAVLGVIGVWWIWSAGGASWLTLSDCVWGRVAEWVDVQHLGSREACCTCFSCELLTVGGWSHNG